MTEVIYAPNVVTKDQVITKHLYEMGDGARVSLYVTEFWQLKDKLYKPFTLLSYPYEVTITPDGPPLDFLQLVVICTITSVKKWGGAS